MWDWRDFLKARWKSHSIIFIRVAVGLIFFSQGILKFSDPRMGVQRFERIGFAHPGFTAHFVGAFEIVCGLMILIGLLDAGGGCSAFDCDSYRDCALPKFRSLYRPGQGFWFAVSDARTDFAMVMCLLFLLVAGAGGWSVDYFLFGGGSSNLVIGIRLGGGEKFTASFDLSLLWIPHSVRDDGKRIAGGVTLAGLSWARNSAWEQLESVYCKRFAIDG